MSSRMARLVLKLVTNTEIFLQKIYGKSWWYSITMS